MNWLRNNNHKEDLVMKDSFRCLLCETIVNEDEAMRHKKDMHPSYKHYGMLWPLSAMAVEDRYLRRTPVYKSDVIADALGVKEVYIKDEGQNFSGSMKDYSVSRAVQIGLKQGFKRFTIVSSGNHAVSLARYTERYNCQAIVFVPASTSKLSLLASLPGVYVVGVQDAIFEDVYELAANVQIEGVYNANVSNEFLLPGFLPVSQQLSTLNPIPDFVIAGVGNGTYLAGIVWGFEQIDRSSKMPKIIPVGMRGAFPIESAFNQGVMIQEYDDFLTEEHHIDSAEGSIAIASYSMPQLMNAMHLSHGFPLGDLTNEDIKKAYFLLSEDEALLSSGAVPEPTGIMGLAAAMKHRHAFQSSDVLLVAFTGHGVKDKEGIERLVPSIANPLLEAVENNRPDLLVKGLDSTDDSVLLVEKGISHEELAQGIKKFISKET